MRNIFLVFSFVFIFVGARAFAFNGLQDWGGEYFRGDGEVLSKYDPTTQSWNPVLKSIVIEQNFSVYIGAGKVFAANGSDSSFHLLDLSKMKIVEQKYKRPDSLQAPYFSDGKYIYSFPVHSADAEPLGLRRTLEIYRFDPVTRTGQSLIRKDLGVFRGIFRVHAVNTDKGFTLVLVNEPNWASWSNQYTIATVDLQQSKVEIGLWNQIYEYRTEPSTNQCLRGIALRKDGSDVYLIAPPHQAISTCREDRDYGIWRVESASKFVFLQRMQEPRCSLPPGNCPWAWWEDNGIIAGWRGFADYVSGERNLLGSSLILTSPNAGFAAKFNFKKLEWEKQ